MPTNQTKDDKTLQWAIWISVFVLSNLAWMEIESLFRAPWLRSIVHRLLVGR
jgi:hypothetical protein